MTDDFPFPEQDALEGESTSTTSTFEEGGEPIVASYADGDAEVAGRRHGDGEADAPPASARASMTRTARLGCSAGGAGSGTGADDSGRGGFNGGGRKASDQIPAR